jgi:hypothetical protein
MPKKPIDCRRLDGKLLQGAMMPKSESTKALQAISEAHDVSVAGLYGRLQHLGAYRMEARWGWEALARWSTTTEPSQRYAWTP